MNEIDADFQYLPGCQFEGDYQGNDGQLVDCGDTAVVRIWWDDYEAAWLACERHFRLVFPVLGTREPLVLEPTT